MLIEGANVLKSVKVNKNELLDVVRVNKEKHIAEYNEAVEDYKEIVVKIAEKNVKIALKNRLKAKAGNTDNFERWDTIPAKPISYETEYNRAIRMFRVSGSSRFATNNLIYKKCLPLLLF